MTIGDTADRALRAAHDLVANGAAVIRTHVDTGRGIGADGVEALESVRRQLDALVELQLVGARRSRSPAPRVPTTWRSLATRSKPDVPSPSAVRRTSTSAHARRSTCSPSSPPIRGWDSTCTWTRRSTSGVHPAPPRRPRRAGFPGSIVAGHCVSLGVQPADVQRRVSEQLAAAGVSVVTLPQTNLYLQGRDPSGRPSAGCPACGRSSMPASTSPSEATTFVTRSTRWDQRPARVGRPRRGGWPPDPHQGLPRGFGRRPPGTRCTCRRRRGRRRRRSGAAANEHGCRRRCRRRVGRRVIHRGREVAETIVHTIRGRCPGTELPPAGVMCR